MSSDVSQVSSLLALDGTYQSPQITCFPFQTSLLSIPFLGVHPLSVNLEEHPHIMLKALQL